MTQAEIQNARRADLAAFLEQHYPGHIVSRSSSRNIYLKTNHSLSIQRSFGGYYDFATDEHGNAIDFLLRHLEYDFPSAVKALAPFAEGQISRSAASEEHDLHLPVSAEPPFHSVINYLTGRAIPGELVNLLISRELLYQDSPHSNAVFITPEKDYCEIRGTCSKVKFHGCRKTSPTRFWYFLPEPGVHPEVAFICEAAIDAVSLYCLCVKRDCCLNAVYVSIGGVCNQAAIDRVKSRMAAVLAVDNDTAGEQCRLRNSELKSIIPVHKDWNEDLRNL